MFFFVSFDFLITLFKLIFLEFFYYLFNLEFYTADSHSTFQRSQRTSAWTDLKKMGKFSKNISEVLRGARFFPGWIQTVAKKQTVNFFLPGFTNHFTFPIFFFIFKNHLEQGWRHLSWWMTRASSCPMCQLGNLKLQFRGSLESKRVGWYSWFDIEFR